MKQGFVVKLILISSLVTIFVNCSSNNDSQIVKLPEIVNPDTGLREIRLRRYDCDFLAGKDAPSDCTQNEEILTVERSTNEPTQKSTDKNTNKAGDRSLEKKSGQSSGNKTPKVDTKSNQVPSKTVQNLKVNELTPWLSPRNRTVVNPTVMYNDLKEKMYLTAYLREFSDKDQDFKDFKYEFEGDLKAYKDMYLRTKDRRYLDLKRVKSESQQIVNAIVNCYDIPVCRDITLIVSFNSIDDKGNDFIESRPFQIDQRETKIKPENAIPNQTKVTVTEPVYLEDIVDEDGYLIDEDKDETTTDAEQVSGNTEDDNESDDEAGLRVDHEEDFTLDPGDDLSKIKEYRPMLRPEGIDQLCEGLVKNNQECPKYLVDPTLDRPNPLLGISTVRPKLRPENLIKPEETKKPPYVDSVDEEVFPPEEAVLDPEVPKVQEPDIDLLPDPDTKTYSTADYHQFLLRKKQQEQFSPSSESNIKTDQTSVNGAKSIIPKKPNIDTDQLMEDTADYIAGEDKNNEGIKASLRPKLRPDNLMQNYIKDQTQALIPVESNDVKDQTKALRPMESIDGKFTYDLSLCGEHLVRAKSMNYYQARGRYNNGWLVNASEYTDSLYETINHGLGIKKKQYGSEVTKQVIEFVGCVLQQRYVKGLDSFETYILNVSAKGGGKLYFTTKEGAHKSHQNGLDIDISYPNINKTTEAFDNFTKNSDEARLVAAFDQARLLIYTERTTVLFTDNRIRTKFCKYLKSKGKLNSKNRTVIEQFMRHANGHHNHYHVRIKCTPQNQGCHHESYPQSAFCGK